MIFEISIQMGRQEAYPKMLCKDFSDMKNSGNEGIKRSYKA